MDGENVSCVKEESVSNHVCASWDVMPTLCELAGIGTPRTDGISFVPELLGKEQQEHDYLYWEFPEGQGMKAIRIGKWKGLILNIKKEGEGNFLLFDLENDPNELVNVASEHPDIVEQMRNLMKEAHEESSLEVFRM